MEIVTRTPTACDSDQAKQQILARALGTQAVATAAAALKPAGAAADWQPGVFELAVAARSHLPAGLVAGDFDGVNIEAIKDRGT